MKRITTSVATTAPTAPLPPATTPLTTAAIAPTAAVGTAAWRRIRTSLDGMAATPLSQGGRGVVMDERRPRAECRDLAPMDRRTAVLWLYPGSREPYHKLFDAVFTKWVCSLSHMRVTVRVCAES